MSDELLGKFVVGGLAGGLFAIGRYIFNMMRSSSQIEKANSLGADAQFELGVKMYAGNGAARNHKNAFELFTKAAEKGHTEAQFMLGSMLYRGEGVERKNFIKACEMLTLAAEKNYADAQYMLGGIYFLGEDGIPSDLSKSAFWLSKAKANGHQSAAELLAKVLQK